MSLLILFRSAATGTTYSYTATGGMTAGGSAASLIDPGLKFSRTYQPYTLLGTGGTAVPYFLHPGLREAYTGSGGLTLAGSATTSELAIYSFTATGGMTLAGAATTGFGTVYSFTASGGMTVAGAATTSELAIYTASVSGGMTLGGSATT